MVNATRIFREFDETSNEQILEVSPATLIPLHSGNWNWLLRDGANDYAHSLDLRFKQITPIGVRFSAPTARDRNNWVEESWSFDWNGKVQLARRVQLAAGRADLFDIDDFARAMTKFCLHGLNILLRARPFPEELEFSFYVPNLRGKMLQNHAMVENVPGAGAVCRTSGNLSRVFNLPLRPPTDAVHLLRDQLLITMGAAAGAFEPLLGGPPLTVSAQRFASVYLEALSSLTLGAIRALVTGPFAGPGAA